MKSKRSRAPQPPDSHHNQPLAPLPIQSPERERTTREDYADPLLPDITAANDQSETRLADDRSTPPRNNKASPRDDEDYSEAGDLYYYELASKCAAILRERKELRECKKACKVSEEYNKRYQAERKSRKRRLRNMEREIKLEQEKGSSRKTTQSS